MSVKGKSGSGSGILARGPSGALAPAVLEFTSSYAVDRRLLEADLAGSLAHVRVLEEAGLLSGADAGALRAGLAGILDDPSVLPEGEEDVHMAIEAHLTARLGDAGMRLHTGRSRNDQVALAARLHVREAMRVVLLGLADVLGAIAARAHEERLLPMPAYTHRQRAIPVTAGFWWASHGAALARDAVAIEAAARNAGSGCPLYAGACAGTTLPVDRALAARLLGFDGPSLNALDTVSDRDFALDAVFACAKLALHLSRLAADVVDYATEEFGFLELADGIACGSSMMPQKKNPDVFELMRGRAARPAADLFALFTLMKGLPAGYNRDLQDDKPSIFSALDGATAALAVLPAALAGIRFRPDRLAAAIESSNAAATDLAEALVTRGMPFREAYGVVGRLVAAAKGTGKTLATIDESIARGVDPSLTPDVLAVARDPLGSPGRRVLAGGPSPDQVAVQAEQLESAAQLARASAGKMPVLGDLLRRIAN